jgi:hypothetical protein
MYKRRTKELTKVMDEAKQYLNDPYGNLIRVITVKLIHA